MTIGLAEDGELRIYMLCLLKLVLELVTLLNNCSDEQNGYNDQIESREESCMLIYNFQPF